MLRKDPKRLFFTDISKMLDNVINHDCVYPVVLGFVSAIHPF